MRKFTDEEIIALLKSKAFKKYYDWRVGSERQEQMNDIEYKSPPDPTWWEMILVFLTVSIAEVFYQLGRLFSRKPKE